MKVPPTPAPGTPATRPNLVIVDCHDLGRHLGCYGHPTVPSDAVDAFAADGLLFEQAYATAPQCSPSRAALYTGRHAHDVGMLGLAHAPFDWRLHDDARHLARYLSDAGWETRHVGVQHVTRDTPEHIRALGFDSHEASHTDAATTARAAVDAVRAAASPFFLNVGFLEPHRDRTGRFHDQPPFSDRGVEIPPYLPDTPEARQEMAEVQGAIRSMDDGFGRILAAIAERDDAANTWVVFTTDHGLAMPRAKATMYDPGLAVALVMRWSARDLGGGRRFPDLVSHVDLVPTVLEGLGIEAPASLHGRSLWPLLQGETTAHNEMVFAEKTFHTAYEPQRAVRSARYKLIANLEVDIMNVPGDTLRSPITPQMIDEIVMERPPLELYDLLEDPGERRNRIDDPALAHVATELKAELIAWMQRTDDPVLRGPVASPYRHAAFAALGVHDPTAP
ncbi:MAG: sulfatase [Trueperaceae bacterium]|nr:sulfatase [Trueperaceae bacterium]